MLSHEARSPLRPTKQQQKIDVMLEELDFAISSKGSTMPRLDEDDDSNDSDEGTPLRLKDGRREQALFHSEACKTEATPVRSGCLPFKSLTVGLAKHSSTSLPGRIQRSKKFDKLEIGSGKLIYGSDFSLVSPAKSESLSA